MVETSDQVNPMLRGKIVMIASVNKEGYIGLNGDSVWKDSHDRRRFKRLTCGHTVAYGRKTWEALGCKPLEDRVNIVISKTLPKDTPGVFVCRSLRELPFAYQAHGKNVLYIIGGGEIFKQMLPEVDVILLTQAEDETIGDTGLGISIDAQVWGVTMTMPVSKVGGSALSQEDIMNELFEKLVDYRLEGKPDAGTMMAANFHEWFTKRFVPMYTTYHNSEATKPLFQDTVVKMYQLWQTVYGIQAPRRQAFLEGHDVTLNYLTGLFFATGDDKQNLKDVLRLRMYGITEVSTETQNAVFAAEKRLAEVLDNPGDRVLSHTYITLQRLKDRHIANTHDSSKDSAGEPVAES